MEIEVLLWAALVLAVVLPLVWVVRRPYFVNETTPELLEKGYTIVLPGIEGKSRLNSNLARGLREGGVEGVIEVIDWTTGYYPLFLLHLRYLRRNRRVAAGIAQQIVHYQEEHPGRPVHLVGHSGGGAMIAWILDELPEDHPVTTATLVAPALSPAFRIHDRVDRTTAGIWNHYSPLDIFFLVIGTTLAGTCDGRHFPAAGAIGFSHEHPKLHQIRYRFGMLKDRHPGGHFGCTDPVFVRRWIAPVLVDAGWAPVPAETG